jgi:hypothetical protein
VRADSFKAHRNNTCARFSDKQYAFEFVERADLPQNKAANDAEIAEQLNASGWMDRFDHPPFGFADRVSRVSKFTLAEQRVFEDRLYKSRPASLEAADLPF